ncbi:Spt4/RpoE2 zinc finger-domain-containing protein [Hypoxylon crocopeplum]|nr:Spt4/RpoE2 zinc finger-domain-containing protein [Hypoxylon crocopeplum]
MASDLPPYTPIPPNQQRYARACMVCSIIMTQAKFRQDGCPNCPFLDLKGSPDAIESCTSGVFEGTMAIADPKRSWMARWQRIDSFVPGVYAVKVNGSLPEDVKQAMEDDGHVYIPYVFIVPIAVLIALYQAYFFFFFLSFYIVLPWGCALAMVIVEKVENDANASSKFGDQSEGEEEESVQQQGTQQSTRQGTQQGTLQGTQQGAQRGTQQKRGQRGQRGRRGRGRRGRK